MNITNDIVAHWFTIIASWQHWYITLIIIYAIASPVVCIALFVIPAPYGRYAPKKYKKFDFSVSSRVGWFIMEVPAMMTILLCYLWWYPPRNGQGYMTNALWWAPLVFLLLWQIHYIYRGIVYPFLLSAKFTHTSSMPLWVAITGATFNILNGTVNGWWMMRIKTYTVQEFYSPHFIIGIVLFFLGFCLHIYVDKYLRVLKNTNKTYVVPQSLPHSFITAPNYFGETLQWLGWAIATWSLAGGLFALFTFANLFPRAWYHRKWYRKTFPEYPSKRKSFIPFII